VLPAGENPAPERGKPPHRESSLGLMEVTTWVKRRQSDGRAVTRSEVIEPRNVVIRRPTVSIFWKAIVGSRKKAMTAGDCGGV
jgi:hypothetical protein